MCPEQAEDSWHVVGLCQVPGRALTGSGYSGCHRCQTTHRQIHVEKSVRKGRKIFNHCEDEQIAKSIYNTSNYI